MKYPPLSHLFQVEIAGITGELGFQSVSGLSSSVEFESVKEGGENTFVHKLPSRTTYSDVTLKRGLFLSQPAQGKMSMRKWVHQALHDFLFIPKTVTIKLLSRASTSKNPDPLITWQLSHTVPQKWELSEFNAEQSSLSIETMTLTYRSFEVIGTMPNT